jgi:hypothetical protein
MRVIPSALLCLLAAGGIAGQASATTYTVNQSIGGAGHVTGTIDTDGTIGTLTPSDFTAWNLVVQGLGASTLLTNTNSGVFISGAAASATASAILFDYNAAADSFLLFQAGGYGHGNTYWCNASSLGTCFQGASAVPEAYNSASQQHESRSGIQAIAGAPGPEPATWMTMVLGFGALGEAMRRRRKLTARVRFA